MLSSTVEQTYFITLQDMTEIMLWNCSAQKTKRGSVYKLLLWVLNYNIKVGMSSIIAFQALVLHMKKSK